MTDQDEPCPRVGAGGTTLYDSAIQRLFGAQMMLLSTLGGIPAADVRERIRESVAVLDEIIGDLRCALHTGGEGGAGTPRTEDASAAGVTGRGSRHQDDARARLTERRHGPSCPFGQTPEFESADPRTVRRRCGSLC